ncbi:MAG: protein kinase, partial [Planctomycetes bacterium]|nr:protein kinase [Planctomycetota bacterium]
MSEESQTPSPNATVRSQVTEGYAAAVRGRFELVAELGSGSSGTVHRAVLLEPYRDLPTGAEVAIKFLRPDLLADEKAVERFHAEGEFGRKLRHDNLAAIHGVETATVAGQPVTFLVMQFVDGRTLRQFFDESDRPVEDLARRIGADAASGLRALHRRGLVHRDIKPENLILTAERQLKIVDLGLVRPFGAGGAGWGAPPGTSPGLSSGWGLAGSVAYAAPESLRGGRSGPRSDLYSLGVVLYELLTGRHPFADVKAADEMIDAHLHRAPPPPSHLRPGLSPFLSQLLLDLLQKDPDRRVRDATELHHILEQGEQSDYWQRLEGSEPVRASRRRLLRMRRPAETPFCGRSAEVARLDAALEQARGGRGSIIRITGPQGSGRRRLCDHTMERWLQDRDAPLLLGGEADRDLGHGEPFASALLDILLRGDGFDSPQAEARAAAE